MQMGSAHSFFKPASSAAWVASDACDFLHRRKIEVPEALAAAAALPVAQLPGTGADAEPEVTARLKWVVSQLGGLKERQRRSLARYVEQQMRKRLDPPQQPVLHSDSDDEVAVGANITTPEVRGGLWPEGVVYSNDYKWDSSVPPALVALYRPTDGGCRRRPPRPSPRCYSFRIRDEDHPAYNQNGLCAAVDLTFGAWVLDYGGIVTPKSEQDATSEYACEFGKKGELTLDSTAWGTEARFINDYRNTGRAQNVDFHLRRDRRGELRQGVYVSAKQGVRAGDELLISYGQGFWRTRMEAGTTMEDFVYRFVGEPPKTGALNCG